MSKPNSNGPSRGQIYAVTGSLLVLAAVIGAGLYIIGGLNQKPVDAKKTTRKKPNSKKTTS